MSTKFDPIRDRLLRRSRQRVANLHAPTSKWVGNARLLVMVFILGFVGTGLVILALIGLYSLMHPALPHVTQATTPVILNPPYTPAPVQTLQPIARTQESTPQPTTTAVASPSVESTYIPEPPVATNVPPAPAPVATPAPLASAPVPPPAPVTAPAQPKVAPAAGYQVYLDGAPTGVTATLVAGVPYVAVDAIAVQAHQGVMIAPGTQEVRVGGQRVAGPVRMQGLSVTVPAKNLAKVLGRTMKIDRANSRINLDPATTPVAAAPANPGNVTVSKPAPTPETPPSVTTEPSEVPVPEVSDGAPVPEAFSPVIAGNGDMQVTVTNVELTHEFRNAYHPSDGHQYAVVFASVQNTSQIVQVSEGKFQLRDNVGRMYESLDTLSTLMLVVLRPGGINYGYLVFEIPQGVTPDSFVYVQENRAPLSVALHH